MTPQQIEDYLKEHPHDDPKNNPTLREQVNHPDYIDRGMNGPLGNKGGTISQIWVEEYTKIMAGGVSSF